MRQSEIDKQFPATLFMLAILVLGAVYLFMGSMETYPAYIHAWTQSDRLALAMNFQENGFDFLHPATYSLLTKDGITQVDFPIHDYLVACISSFLKVEIIPIFRGYNLIYSLIGLFYFFRLSLLSLKSPLKSIWLCSFVFTLPFYVYYQNGFLPSAPSLANFFIALYFLYRARENRKIKDYIVGTLFLTLAALARSPFFIFLFALLLQQVWQLWQQKRFDLSKVLYPLIGISFFFTYFLYNQYLAKTYGSMFLSEWLYFESFADLLSVVGTALDRWGNQLLSPFHAILLAGLLLASLSQFKRKGMPNKLTTSLFHYFLISSAGVILFFIAFGKQFGDHDYYYLDTFLPLLSILLLILLNRLEIPKRFYTSVITLSGIFFFYFFTYAKGIQEERYTPSFDDRTEYAYSIYKKSKAQLKKWGVTKNDSLFVLEANSTNMPFTIWGNKGFTNLNGSEEVLKPELDSSFTYAVLVDSFFVRSSFKAYPDLIKRLRRINGNGEISLYEKSLDNNPAQFFDNLIYYGHSNFDQSNNLPDSAILWTAKESWTDSMGKSLKIDTHNLYTLSFKHQLKRVVPNKAMRIHILGDFLQTQDSSKLRIVASVNDYYGSQYTENHFDSSNQWMDHQFNFKIDPAHLRQNDELSVYFWNPEKEVVFVDNFRILIYQ